MHYIRNFYKEIRPIILSILLLLVLHSIIRIFFVIHYSQSIPIGSIKEGFNIFLWGFQMDLSSIVWLNAPVILIFFISFFFPGSQWVLLRAIRILFVVLNAIGLALNIVDIGYFEFCQHRSNADLLYIIPDSLGFMGSILRNYWPLLFFFVALLWLLIIISKKCFMWD